jgi:DNA/RNA endonuclease YhcR with UshA esterase domain
MHSTMAMMVVGWAMLVAPPPVVPLDEVGKHVGKEVTVELVVASSRLLESGAFCFLNSRKHHTDKDNFTVAIDAEGLSQFAEEKIEDPAERFQGKTIRVTGKVSVHRDRPQIVVDDPRQIVIVVVIKEKR